MADSVFDRPREQAFRGCPICGSRGSVRVAVTIQKQGSGRKGGKAVGRSVSLCDEHGEEFFLRIEADVEKMRRGSR